MKYPLIRALIKLHLITPLGLYRLMSAFLTEGITLMAILRFASKYYAKETAIVSEDIRLNYREVFYYSKMLAISLNETYLLKSGDRVGVLCRNHVVSALVLPALSRLGVHVRLLNTDIGVERMAEILDKGKLDFLIYDEELKAKCLPNSLPCRAVSTDCLYKLRLRQNLPVSSLPHIFRGGQISVLTGGTSGNYKEASRKTGLFQFLPPFFALLKDIQIQNYSSVYVVLPFYHGFGLGVLIIALAMGKKICLSRHFKAENALSSIQTEEVEVLPIVPTMLSRIWQVENAAKKMLSVKCVISGGDRLDKKLVDLTHQYLGKVMFNLYGTSEAGFFMLATPNDLSVNAETTLGKPIRGVQCEVRELNELGVGSLWVRSKWAMIGAQNVWQCTGDLVYRNSSGYYFHCGIAKNMVVCGGENVYPENVERAINNHPDVIGSKVFSVADVDFGYVLHAQVELIEKSELTETELKEWLRAKISRAEMPHAISFQPLDVLSTGKRKR